MGPTGDHDASSCLPSFSTSSYFACVSNSPFALTMLTREQVLSFDPVFQWMDWSSVVKARVWDQDLSIACSFLFHASARPITISIRINENIIILITSSKMKRVMYYVFIDRTRTTTCSESKDILKNVYVPMLSGTLLAVKHQRKQWARIHSSALTLEI